MNKKVLNQQNPFAMKIKYNLFSIITYSFSIVTYSEKIDAMIVIENESHYQLDFLKLSIYNFIQHKESILIVFQN